MTRTITITVTDKDYVRKIDFTSDFNNAHEVAGILEACKLSTLWQSSTAANEEMIKHHFRDDIKTLES